MNNEELDKLARSPLPIKPNGFNPKAILPHGLTIEHIRKSMADFVDFLGFINKKLYTKKIPRLEMIMMAANFSSLVGEFIIASIAKYCPTLAKNRYHNGHPDLIPSGRFPGDAVQYAQEGIEVKASRYRKGWQGHNPEESWLMVFMFESHGQNEAAKDLPPKPFGFVGVAGAQLTKEDWKYSGRSATSRRTITASVTTCGYEKMMRNWIYKTPGLVVLPAAPPGDVEGDVVEESGSE
jgi:hypothetical protein